MAPSNSSLGHYYFFRVGPGAGRHIFRADPVVDAINGLRPRTDLHNCVVCHSKRMSLNEMEAEVRHPAVVGDCCSLAVYQPPDVVQELGVYLSIIQPPQSTPLVGLSQQVTAYVPAVTTGVVTFSDAHRAADRTVARFDAPAPGCECGAHKVYGTGRGGAGHSSWCPWSRP